MSKVKYYVFDKTLVMPIGEVKGISGEISSRIESSRCKRYVDIYDFVYKTREFINEDLFKILVKSGFFDSFNINRHTLDINMESLLNYANLSDGSGLISKPMIIEVDEYDDAKLRQDELEIYGMYISNHPASKYKNVVKLNNIDKYLFKNIKCVVLITRIKNIVTKKNENMAFVSANDETGNGDFTVFPKEMELLKNIENGNLVEIAGSVSKRFDKVSIIVNNIKKVV